MTTNDNKVRNVKFFSELDNETLSRLYGKYVRPDMHIAFYKRFGFYIDMDIALKTYKSRVFNNMMDDILTSD